MTAEEKDKEWRDALAGYMHGEELQRVLESGSPEEVITRFMREVRKIDWRWREEIEKHLPQLGVMSFAGPVSTIRWLMERVEIKPEHKTLADRLKAIQASNMSDEEKTHARLTSIFPNLK